MIEKVFFNGNILTQDRKRPMATAIAVGHGKIIAVGNDEEVCQLQTATTAMIDFQHATVLPGFNDAHIHLWKVGNLMTYLLDLRGVRSIVEMQQLLSDYAIRNPQLEWIQARGFNEALFDNKRMPDRFDLDKVIRDRPVCVMRTCAHQVVVNSKALEVCGIDKRSSPPRGGEIKLSASGELSGRFTETALGLVLNKIPSYTQDQYHEMILAAQQQCIRLGITAVTDPAVMPDLMNMYKSMDQNGELKIRVNAIPIRVPDGADKPLPLPPQYASDHLKINSVKFFSDGGLSGRTAALKHPYKNSDERGVLRLNKDFFRQVAFESQEQGFRLATHAIGDAAIDMVLDVYEEIFPENTKHIHHRIEHLGLPSFRNLDQMKKMNVSAVTQPVFLYELGKNFRQYLTEDYLQRCYPVKSLLQRGINVSLSSDAPVVKNFSPLMNIGISVERKDAEGFLIAEEERISVAEAIHAYTMGSAAANGEDHVYGSISEGKWADFIIADKNPLEISASQIQGVNIMAAYINGEKSE